MKKIIEATIFLIIFTGVLIAGLKVIKGEIRDAEKSKQAPPAIAQAVENIEPKQDPLEAIHVSPDEFTRNYEINKLYEEIHAMANTLVIAEDELYRGLLEVNEMNLKIARKKAEVYPIEDKDKILKIISRWEKNDFSRAVEDHNYIWKKYNGELGKAIKLKPEIQAIVDAQKKKASR